MKTAKEIVRNKIEAENWRYDTPMMIKFYEDLVREGAKEVRHACAEIVLKMPVDYSYKFNAQDAIMNIKEL